MPGARQAIAPIRAWALAWFDAKADTAVLERAWRLAVMSAAPGDATSVAGPASAMVAACKRIGWQPVAPFAFAEPTGYVINCKVEAPATVCKAALEALDLWWSRRSSLCGDIGGPHTWNPTRLL